MVRVFRTGPRPARIVAAVLAAGTAASAAADVAGWTPELLRRVADDVSAQRLERHTRILGSDGFEGRAPGTTGGERAAAYLEQQLRMMGLRPLGDSGTFRQRVPMVQTTPLAGSRLILRSLGEDRRLELGEGYLLLTTGAQTFLPRPLPMVFVGYGIVAPEFDYNDYQGLDVRGKVVVYLDGEPPSNDPDYFAGKRPTVFASAETKQRIALSRGAAGSVLLPAWGDEPDQVWARLRRQFGLSDLELPSDLPRHLSLILHPREAYGLFDEALFEFEQVVRMHRDGTMRSFFLPVMLRFEGEFETRAVQAPNIVGGIEGCTDESVVLIAHYDHLGIGPEVAGDRIYNGVVDNAIGVAGVLEAARVLTDLQRRARRSVIVLLVTGEEHGLLGSRYFLAHSPVPLTRIAAAINVDGLAFQDTFDDVIGVGAELSDLGTLLAQTAEALGLRTARPPPQLWSSESFARSDQRAFAEAGIPSLLIFEGFSWRNTPPEEVVPLSVSWLENVYHTPFDDLSQPLDFEAARQHAAVIAALTAAIAEAPRAPAWRPGTRYSYRRLLQTSGGRR